MTLVLRSVKGSALTHDEVDGNFEHFTDALTLKADLEAELISGGETSVDGTTITIAPAQWRIPPSSYAKVTETEFTGIAYSASGLQRYVAFYGTTSNTIVKVEGTEDDTAVMPTTPEDSVLISYALVGDDSISDPVQDLSGYQLKSDKSSDIETDKLSSEKYPSVKSVYDWGKATFPFEAGFALSDETSDLTTGTAKVTFRIPCAITITHLYASVNTAPTGSTLVVDINENGTSILSTKLSIDASEKTSITSATPYVLSDTVLSADSEITIDIDQAGAVTAGKGLKVFIIGTRN